LPLKTGVFRLRSFRRRIAFSPPEFPIGPRKSICKRAIEKRPLSLVFELFLALDARSLQRFDLARSKYKALSTNYGAVNLKLET
jgi:hypothetical protein